MKLFRILKHISKAIIPTKAWRILQDLRYAQVKRQEQKAFTMLFHARTAHAPSAFAPPPHNYKILIR